MVRTRKMGSAEKALQSPRTSSYGRVRTERRIILNDDEDDDSDESGYVVHRRGRPRKKRLNLKCSPPAKTSDSQESPNDTNEEVEDSVERRNTPLARGRKPVVVDEEEGTSGSSPAENTPPLEIDGGIRRSTRQRKFTYDTLNQSWLLGGSRIPDFANLDHDDGEVDHVTKGKAAKKADNRNEGDIDPKYEDMYSRIKRERRKAVSSFYNLPRKTRHRLQNGNDTEESMQFDTEEEDDLEDSTEGSSEENVTANVSVRHKKYYLRQKKPIIDRFQMPIETRKKNKVAKNIFHLSPARPIFRLCRNRRPSFRSPAHKSPKSKHRRLHATHNSSTSSSSSSSEDEAKFERRKAKSMARARSRFFPMNFKKDEIASNCILRDRVKIGSSLADVDPMNVDRNVTFDGVGGLAGHIRSLKEMLLLPLMYPEVFEKFKITPPRGVLFYGAPGTGKTLVARALSNECSQGERKVAFFMRKGADCLSKWVGESERQLRLLFDQAYSMRPSIIFFDEIDGLAPVRSTRQDQIHSSIVSTLLALMDGLDNRGEVVVIGATNRIDAIDPALRRPGRFDREFNFPLPTLEARRSILHIHTKEWNPPLMPQFVESLAQRTVGYCGADIKALCAEAAFLALRRQFPEIYESKTKLQLDVSRVKIEAKDFSKAVSQLVPASHRSTVAAGRPLSSVVQPLVQNSLNSVLDALKATFPQGFAHEVNEVEPSSATLTENESTSVDLEQASDGESVTGDELPEAQPCLDVETFKYKNACSSSTKRLTYVQNHRPRLLITGSHGQGQSTHIAPAVLHYLERYPIHKMDLPALFAVTAKSPEESCSQIFVEAHRVLPSILYLPHLGQWYETLSETVRATFLTLLEDMDPTSPLLLLATSDCPFEELPEQVQILFDPLHGEVVSMKNPSAEARREFFSNLILHETKRAPKQKRKLQRAAKKQRLEVVPILPPRTLSKSELKRLVENEESTLRELRMFLREILYKLAQDRRFAMFTRPVDTEEVSDYLTVIKTPMDLETMLTKVDLHCYASVAEFLSDIDLISHNALEYNPDRDPSDKIIRHRACALKDTAHALVVSELDPEFEQICREIQEARKLRGVLPTKYVPKVYPPKPRNVPISENEGATAPVLLSGEANPMAETPSSKEGQETSTEKYSHRLRGSSIRTRTFSSIVPVIRKSQTTVVNNGARKSTVRQPIMIRGKKSPWFGARRRHPIFRVAVNLRNCKTIKQAIGRPKKSVGLTNGFVDKIELEALGIEKISKDASQAPRNGEVRMAKYSWTANDGTTSNEILPIDPLTLDNDKTKLNSSSEKKKGRKKRKKGEAEDSTDSDELTFNFGPKTLEEIASDTTEINTSSLMDTTVKSEASQEETETSKNNTMDSETGVVRTVDVGVNVEVVPKQSVNINEKQLMTCLDKIVSVTKGCTVDTLERFHCRLHQCIRSHRQEWDRTELLQDLEKLIEQFRLSVSQRSNSLGLSR